MTSKLRLKKHFAGLKSRSLTFIVMQWNHKNVTDKPLDKGLASRIFTILHNTNRAGHLKSYTGNKF